MSTQFEILEAEVLKLVPAEHALLAEHIIASLQARQDFSRKLKWIHPILAAKNDLAINACGGPGRPASLVAYPTRGRQHRSRNDWTRCRKACIFTPLKLRENTCTIATGD